MMAAAAVIAGCLWWWTQRAPEAARLLPESDAVVYLNLRPVRLATAFSSLPQVKHDPDYEAFVQATGFEFERDLDEAAIAVHLGASAQPAASTPSGATKETRYSEVFIGRFNSKALTQYFEKMARAKDSYAGRQVFTIPVEGRTVRVAVLSAGMVVVSNVEDASAIRGMIDRAETRGMLAGGPELVKNFYKDVPVGSLAWGLARSKNNLPLPNGLEISVPEGVTWVGSLRYAGTLELKAQAIAASDADAQKITESLNTLLAIFHSVQSNSHTQGMDADVKNVFDSLQVTQEHNRAIVTASVPAGFLQKLAVGAGH